MVLNEKIIIFAFIKSVFLTLDNPDGMVQEMRNCKGRNALAPLSFERVRKHERDLDNVYFNATFFK